MADPLIGRRGHPTHRARQAHDTAAALRADLDRSGYYPDLIDGTLRDVLGSETVTAHVVHQETTLDDELGVQRHVTVLVLTPSRMVVCHTDEQGPTELNPYPHAITTAEALAVSAVTSVALTTVVADPAQYRPGGVPREATLVVGWGAIGHLELEPATCGDETCQADHGYSGTMTADDLSLRASADVDGADVVDAVVRFAAALSEASARARG